MLIAQCLLVAIGATPEGKKVAGREAAI